MQLALDGDPANTGPPDQPPPTRRTRADVHRPSAITPSDYEYVGQEVVKIEGLGDATFILAECARIQAHMARTGGTYSGHDHGGNCGVCGSVMATYTILFWHRPTNVYVRMGQDCAQKCEVSYDETAHNAFRRAVTDAREAQAGKRKALALLTDAGLAPAWPIYAADYGQLPETDRPQSNAEEYTVRDIVGKLVTYGSISKKQESFLRSLLERITTRPAREAARAAEREAAAPAPTGRLDVSGEVVSVKAHESDFGVTVKMTVKTDAGWILWTTKPAASAAKHGDRVTLRVTVTPSPKDPKFAFGKRPTLLSETVAPDSEAR